MNYLDGTQETIDDLWTADEASCLLRRPWTGVTVFFAKGDRIMNDIDMSNIPTIKSDSDCSHRDQVSASVRRIHEATEEGMKEDVPESTPKRQRIYLSDESTRERARAHREPPACLTHCAKEPFGAARYAPSSSGQS